MCKKRNIYTMTELSTALQTLFNRMNAAFFDGQLERCVITVKEGSHKHAFGWITTAKGWQQGKEKRHEINIACDYLSRPVDQVAETLLHEMVHLYNMQEGIKDTSRSGIYHNTKFRDAALAHHLTCDQISGGGWTVTALDDFACDWLRDNCPVLSFRIYKQPEIRKSGEKKPSSTRKYVCPECGQSVRATKEVHLFCADCSNPEEYGCMVAMELA